MSNTDVQKPDLWYVKFALIEGSAFMAVFALFWFVIPNMMLLIVSCLAVGAVSMFFVFNHIKTTAQENPNADTESVIDLG